MKETTHHKRIIIDVYSLVALPALVITTIWLAREINQQHIAFFILVCCLIYGIYRRSVIAYWCNFVFVAAIFFTVLKAIQFNPYIGGVLVYLLFTSLELKSEFN